MIKRVAVLLDGGFVQKRLFFRQGKQMPTAQEILDFAHSCVGPDEELFRIYYYDCPPFSGTLTHPVSGETEDYSQTEVFAARTALIDEIAQADYVAFRPGVLTAAGWKLKYTSQKALAKSTRTCTVNDFVPDWAQKRVDMNIGLDVAWLASKGIIDRIILVSADTDFIPAMEFARREGVQVVIVPMDSSTLSKSLRANADEVRDVKA